MTRSRLILLDANVVIHLFELDLWKQVVARYQIVIAQTVVDEVHFFERDGDRIPIDREEMARAGSVEIRAMTASEVQAYCDRFDPTYYDKLDPGEAESLALLERDTQARICSADKIVWRVLGNTNQADRGVSLEEILRQVGLTKALPERFSKAFRERWCKA
ncbi:MAG: type II toxin-antitoxin system VapC family toxin, partial [Phycisphaerales bacterium]|nr:type II toxin-antitoxin system VapC family toxin [Phycisphaerales bacterium]